MLLALVSPLPGVLEDETEMQEISEGQTRYFVLITFRFYNCKPVIFIFSMQTSLVTCTPSHVVVTLLNHTPLEMKDFKLNVRDSTGFVMATLRDTPTCFSNLLETHDRRAEHIDSLLVLLKGP